MSLTGTFSTMALGDLLQWIDQSRGTGTLLVQGERYVKRICVRQGRIVATSSNDPNDHLGHFLLRLGLISEPDLRKALQVQRQRRRLLGEILVGMGAVAPADLQAALDRKAEETIFGLFLWREARFEFQPEVLPAVVALPIDLAINDVLMKGLTWFDELQHIRKVFVSNRSVVTRTRKPLPAPGPGKGSLERRILELVDGRRCIADICLAVHASEFVVCRALYTFLQEGLVEVTHKKASTPVSPRKPLAGLLEEARSLLRAGEVGVCLKVVEEARLLDPHDAALTGLAREAQDAFAAQVSRDGLQPSLVPVPTRPPDRLQQEDLTPEEMFILSRADGSWDICSIVSVCPFPEVEALVHLKRLRDRGMIDLREPSR